ncbi:MAG: multidrug efflux SMR transporter [Thermodesulfovibrionales bacterium]|nr:multidrug efflux SMR transporter [Thermodesulfovibrionales bacterium]
MLKIEMSWVFILIAALFEIGWIYSLKATAGFTKIIPLLFYACCGLGAAFFLSQGLKHISTGTAYAVWVGIAVAGTNIISMLFLEEPVRVLKLLFVMLIIIGVAGLKVIEQ